MKGLSCLAAACMLVVIAAAPARADLSVRLTNAQLTATSDVILIGVERRVDHDEPAESLD